MSIYFTLVSFIDLIGLIIGLSLGLGLIIYKWKQKASLFLALFILCYSFGILPSILIDFQIEDSFLTNLFIQLDWSWLLFLFKTGNSFVLDFMSVLNVLILFAVSFNGIFQAQIQPVEKSIAESKGKQAKNQSPIHNQGIKQLLKERR